MTQRELNFQTFGDIRAELGRLQRGYTKLGQWDLVQTCDHLAYFMECSMDGHNYKVPWLLRALFGRMVLKRILTQRRMKAGVPSPKSGVPLAGGNEAVAISRLLKAIDRLEKHPGEFQDSPFFGHLTPEQTRELMLIHCQHHFGFLNPTT